MQSLPNQPLQYPPKIHQNKPDNPIAIPCTVDTAFNVHCLPPVNHDQALKRVKVQFTGLGDVFIFYNQLLYAMEQFGI